MSVYLTTLYEVVNNHAKFYPSFRLEIHFVHVCAHEKLNLSLNSLSELSFLT